MRPLALRRPFPYEISGLDGRESSDDINISYAADDPKANQAYLEIKRSRGELDAG
jgi:hypothetical protein